MDYSLASQDFVIVSLASTLQQLKQQIWTAVRSHHPSVSQAVDSDGSQTPIVSLRVHWSVADPRVGYSLISHVTKLPLRTEITAANVQTILLYLAAGHGYDRVEVFLGNNTS